MEEYVLDELDYKILNLISNDARMSFLEVSRICNVSGAAVHQRVQKMMTNNIITGSEFKLNLNKIGYETCAYLSLRFSEFEEINTIVEKLNAVPEIVECHLTVGDYDLFVKVYAHNNAHLLDIVKRWIKPLNLVRMESMISYGEVFRKQILFTDKIEEI
ncbi:MAG: Lrp/AsnC family transcriptional regulator [Candidatus Azobacteroides sp.]|nr:Lrp/AsnC family transcriptional regulator [Candidatus Azobacteroides sp.]